MNLRWIGMTASLWLATGCSRPSALAVCQRLEQGDVARNCQVVPPEGLLVAARERIQFELKDTPQADGPRFVPQVLRFESEEHLLGTARSFESTLLFGGTQRFISTKARILVILPAAASKSDIDFARDLVNEL